MNIYIKSRGDVEVCERAAHRLDYGRVGSFPDGALCSGGISGRCLKMKTNHKKRFYYRINQRDLLLRVPLVSRAFCGLPNVRIVPYFETKVRIQYCAGMGRTLSEFSEKKTKTISGHHAHKGEDILGG